MIYTHPLILPCHLIYLVQQVDKNENENNHIVAVSEIENLF